MWQSHGMELDLAEFSTPQQQALFELLILAMYADGHLTTFEDEQLQKMLYAMGHTAEFDRQREFDTVVTRIRPFVQSIEKAKERALWLAGAFTTPRQHLQVLEAVEGVITSDGQISPWEIILMTELQAKFNFPDV
jgi:hypothetical protein